MKPSSAKYLFWLEFLENLNLSEDEAPIFWSAYKFMFKTNILVGPSEEPHLNMSCSEAFKQIIDPEFPIPLRWTLCCFLTAELALLDNGDLAESVESACLIGPDEFDSAVQQAPEGNLLNLPRFQNLYTRIRLLEEGHNSESNIALAF